MQLMTKLVLTWRPKILEMGMLIGEGEDKGNLVGGLRRLQKTQRLTQMCSVSNILQVVIYIAYSRVWLTTSKEQVKRNMAEVQTAVTELSSIPCPQY